MVSQRDTQPDEALQKRARIIAQDRDQYKVKTDNEELRAEVSGRYRYEAVTVSDFPAVGGYVQHNYDELIERARKYFFPKVDHLCEIIRAEFQ